MAKFYSTKFYSSFKKKPALISKDIIQFRARISKRLKHYKSRIFRRFKRFSFLQKKFFKRTAFKGRRRSDLLFLYKKPRLYSRWVPKRYFSRNKKSKRINFFIRRMRQKYVRINNWRNRLRARYYRRTPKLYATSPFRYQLIDDSYNRKKFRIWITKRFFGKKKRFVFRIFYFFRKLEKSRFNFKSKTGPISSSNFDSRIFFEKYRKFSLWALTYSWHKFHPRTMLKLKRRIRFLKKKRRLIKLRVKSQRFNKKSKKNLLKGKRKSAKKGFFNKKSKKKYREKSLFTYPRKYIKFKFNRRKFSRKSTHRRSRQISRFLQIVRLAYKFPHSKRYFKSRFYAKLKKLKKFVPAVRTAYTSFFRLNKKLSNFDSFFRPRSHKFFKFSRANSKQLFFTKRRLPKIFYKNFFYKKRLPLAYYFTRHSKNISIFFKSFKKRPYTSRFIKYKHRSRVPFRIKRVLNKLRFYQSKIKRSRFSRKINKKFFFIRRKYALFIPYLGYFRKFGKKRFIYKKKRKKFFRFFKKFFSKFHSVTGIPSPRSKLYKRHSSRVKFFIHIFRSVNNMFVNVSAPRGRTLYAYSAGRTNFRGSKRLSPIAIETMGKSVSLLLKNSKILQVGVVFHTPIDYLIRALMRGFRANIKFTHFRYHMTKPHNGLRLRATRRI